MAYAIFQTGGKQYRVAEGDVLDVDVLGTAEAGAEMTFSEVLFHVDGDRFTRGEPRIDGARVVAEVVEHRKDRKVIAFKFRRRKGYHRTVGHRRRLTRLKIKSISAGGSDHGRATA